MPAVHLTPEEQDKMEGPAREFDGPGDRDQP